MALAARCFSSFADDPPQWKLREAIEQALADAYLRSAGDAREVLQFFAGIDLTQAELPSQFAWYVLKARAIIEVT